MSSQPNRRLSATLLLLLILAIPFVLMYYLSTDFYKRRSEQWTRSPAEVEQAVKPQLNADRVILEKNERVAVGRTSLVYRGIEKKMIHIDLYLLDLDPEESFRLKFSKKEAKKSISIGDNTYRLLSMNDRFLNLKIISQFRTP